MLFQERLANQIILGEKTRTLRPKKKGEKLVTVDGITKVLTKSGKTKHAVGSIRKIPYGRGLHGRWWHPEESALLKYPDYCNARKGFANWENLLQDHGYIPLQYQITAIEEMPDVRNIDHQGALDEGFVCKLDFLTTWMMLYDDTFAYRLQEETWNPDIPDYCPQWLYDRPDKKYQNQFWYTFKLLKN